MRKVAGRDPPPSGGIIDAQSVKTTSSGGPQGYDGGKKVSGRKRRLLVDTLGLVLRADIHTADLQERATVSRLLDDADREFPHLSNVWGDQGYIGSGREWIERKIGWTVDVVRHPPKARGAWVPLGTGSDPRPFEWRRLPPERSGFRGPLPRRWVVERTFGWCMHSRRFARDYERLPATDKALIHVAMTRLMLRRLARHTHK